MDSMRTCTKCGETKPLGDYGRDRSKKDGLKQMCKKCCVAQSRAYREANRDQIIARRRAYREANRDKVNAQQRTYREANPEQITAQKRTYHEAQNSATRMAATRNTAPWTPEEDAYLLTTTDTATIAALNLGRTYDSTMSRRSKLHRQNRKDTTE